VAGCLDQAALIRLSWVNAITLSSRPISSTILPLITFSTVVPVKCILRPLAAGRPPIKKSALSENLGAGPLGGLSAETGFRLTSEVADRQRIHTNPAMARLPGI
jgi:hypothetical protein